MKCLSGGSAADMLRLPPILFGLGKGLDIPVRFGQRNGARSPKRIVWACFAQSVDRSSYGADVTRAFGGTGSLVRSRVGQHYILITVVCCW